MGFWLDGYLILPDGLLVDGHLNLPDGHLIDCDLSNAHTSTKTTLVGKHWSSAHIIDENQVICHKCSTRPKLMDSLSLVTQIYLKIILTISDVISSHYSNTISITEKCHLIKLKLSQNMLRRHDFKVFMQSMRISSTIANRVALLIVSLILYCQVLKVVHNSLVMIWKDMEICNAIARGVILLRTFVILYIQTWKELHQQVIGSWKLLMTCDGQDILSDRSCYFNLSFIGGGKANEFSYHEIQPYAVSQNALRLLTNSSLYHMYSRMIWFFILM